MKSPAIIAIAVCVMFRGAGAVRQAEFPVLTGPYLGQKPPGMTPEVFALGIISVDTGLHSTPDKNIGQNPGLLGFYEKIQMQMSLSFRTMVKNRFLSDLDDKIWYIEKKGKWSEPIPLQMELEGEQLHWQLSFSTKGTLYSTATVDDGIGGYGRYDIYKSEHINNKYKKPELLGEQINTSESDLTPFIAPDESYLIFSSARPGGFGRTDLYICYRNRDRSWTNAISLGPGINTSSDEICPIVTKDGKYLFFLGEQDGISGVYWVSIKIIEELRPKE